jgi:hypothetical protein
MQSIGGMDFRVTLLMLEALNPFCSLKRFSIGRYSAAIGLIGQRTITGNIHAIILAAKSLMKSFRQLLLLLSMNPASPVP